MFYFCPHIVILGGCRCIHVLNKPHFEQEIVGFRDRFFDCNVYDQE